MTTVAQLTIEMAANVARLATDMDSARRKVDSTFAGISKDVAKLKQTIGGVFAGFSAAQTIGKIVTVQREFDVLNSSLVTVTGSSMVAEQQMRWIKQFAATTPYQLADVTAAFVKMRALGLDASQEALASYGNTASAMGKGLNQMIEAVADAATGEFERLKEFGIRARKEGENVAFTFQGVTTNVRNNAQEITQYLQRIGDVNFAGAMAQRAQTLDGAISNLADSWDDLFRTVSQGNVGSAIYESVRAANGALSDAITLIDAMNRAAINAGSGTSVLASAQSALSTVLETVLVLGTNVKYVLVQTGTELGGLVAQFVQVLQGNFSGAAEIGRQMKADAEAARKQVEATTSAILNARRLAGVASSGVGMDEPRFARLLNGGGSTPRTRSEAAPTAAALREARKREAEELKKVIDLAEHRNRLFDEEFEKSEAQRLTVEGRIRDAREMLEAIQAETRLMGLNGLEREKAVALLELERKGVVKGTEAYERLAPAILKAIEARSGKAAELMTIDEVIEESAASVRKLGRNTATTMAESIADGILNGARDGVSIMDIFWREVKAQAARTILQPMIQPVAQGFSDIISGGLGALTNALGMGVTSSGYNPGASMGFSTDWEQYLPSYAGGGYTGAGSRSGGMDGRGGFLAMLHPNETVVDHTRGQSSGGNLVVNVINQAGAEVSASSRTGANGEQILEVLVARTKASIAGDFANRSGDVSRGLEAGYGIRPAMA